MAAGSVTSAYGPPPGLARLPAAAELPAAADLPALAKPGPAPDSGFWSRLDGRTCVVTVLPEWAVPAPRRAGETSTARPSLPVPPSLGRRTGWNSRRTLSGISGTYGSVRPRSALSG